jgi:hypothetical protein
MAPITVPVRIPPVIIAVAENTYIKVWIAVVIVGGPNVARTRIHITRTT